MNDNIAFEKIGSDTLFVISKADQFNQWMYRTIRPALKGQILEIGSGIGNISKLAIKDGYSMTLSDYSETYCNYLKTHFSFHKNVRDVINIDLQNPAFFTKYAHLKESFDTVVMLNVIEHLKDDAVAVENCKYLLKNKGCLVVLAPSYSWLYCKFDKELGHFRRYTKKSLSLLFEKNDLIITEKKYFNFLGIGGWFFYGKILRMKMIGKNEMSTYNRLVNAAKWLDKIVANRIGLSTIVSGSKK